LNVLLLMLVLQNPDSLTVRFSAMTAVTGYEQAMGDSLLALLPGSTRDRIGNVTLSLGRGTPKRLVYCDLDEIGYAVGNITNDGYVTLRRVGGGARLYPLFDQQIEGHRVTLSTFTPFGVVDVPMGWPLRYSHSPAEVVDLKDLLSLADMVRAVAEDW
jgi:putative aminopeptidase FrvX